MHEIMRCYISFVEMVKGKDPNRPEMQTQVFTHQVFRIYTKILKTEKNIQYLFISKARKTTNVLIRVGKNVFIQVVN